MKHIFLNRIPAVIAVMFVFFFSSCKDKDNGTPATRITTVRFSGATEIPANTSTGSGSGKLTFDPVKKTVTYDLTWKLGDPAATTTDMHFHGAADGSDTKSSPVVVELEGFSTGNSGTFSGVTRVLTDVEISQLLGGMWYLNIHSTTVPGGELRANIKF